MLADGGEVIEQRVRTERARRPSNPVAALHA
jgi:hypothetical protein